MFTQVQNSSRKIQNKKVRLWANILNNLVADSKVKLNSQIWKKIASVISMQDTNYYILVQDFFLSSDGNRLRPGPVPDPVFWAQA